MTTITIDQDIKLSVKNFTNYEELVSFIIYDNTNLEIENLNENETSFLNSLDSFQNFKQVANSIWK